MNKFIIGLILGIAIAGGLAYYLNNAPTQFVNKVTNNQSGDLSPNASAPVILAPGTKYQVAESTAVARPATSADGNSANVSAPSYDFYDVLQGKKAASSASAETTTKKPVRYYLQAGSFSSQNLANDMKARLALLGVDAKIKSKQDNGKMINRIIIGPFNSEDEADDTINTLKDNGITATLIKSNN
jgi:cell division protein FtsN